MIFQFQQKKTIVFNIRFVLNIRMLVFNFLNVSIILPVFSLGIPVFMDMGTAISISKTRTIFLKIINLMQIKIIKKIKKAIFKQNLMIKDQKTAILHSSAENIPRSRGLL